MLPGCLGVRIRALAQYLKIRYILFFEAFKTKGSTLMNKALQKKYIYIYIYILAWNFVHLQFSALAIL